ncbi:MAG: DUF3124 domain-containing protein [Saprospiraceae bacterium]
MTGCDHETTEKQVTSILVEDWDSRKVTIQVSDSLEAGSTYLSSYSQIYVQTGRRRFSLTGTISMRNINQSDTVYIDKAKYFKTDGAGIRSYFDEPIYLAPLETVEIIITEQDIEGGTGDNFVFEWHKPPGTHDPFFEGVFITIYGQQGISFTTRGIRID